MLHIKLRVITTLGDMAGLPVGTRIATNHNKLLISEEFAGRVTWSEHGELSVLTPIVDWLPVIVLPPVIDMEKGILEFTLEEPLRPKSDEREG